MTMKSVTEGTYHLHQRHLDEQDEKSMEGGDGLTLKSTASVRFSEIQQKYAINS